MIEEIAEIIWRSEYRRATQKERSIPWSEVAEGERAKYRYVARDILCAMEDAIIKAKDTLLWS